MRLDERLPAPVEVAAYYIASEALTNVEKHAHANAVQLIASNDDAVLTLEVRDDGVGGADVGRGSGILGLIDRAEALGGTISSQAHQRRHDNLRPPPQHDVSTIPRLVNLSRNCAIGDAERNGDGTLTTCLSTCAVRMLEFVHEAGLLCISCGVFVLGPLARPVAAAPADHLTITTVVANMQAGTVFTVQVEARDGTGALDTDFNGTVALNAAAGAGGSNFVGGTPSVDA